MAHQENDFTPEKPYRVGSSEDQPLQSTLKEIRSVARGRKVIANHHKALDAAPTKNILPQHIAESRSRLKAMGVLPESRSPTPEPHAWGPLFYQESLQYEIKGELVQIRISGQIREIKLEVVQKMKIGQIQLLKQSLLLQALVQTQAGHRVDLFPQDAGFQHGYTIEHTTWLPHPEARVHVDNVSTHHKIKWSKSHVDKWLNLHGHTFDTMHLAELIIFDVAVMDAIQNFNNFHEDTITAGPNAMQECGVVLQCKRTNGSVETEAYWPDEKLFQWDLRPRDPTRPRWESVFHFFSNSIDALAIEKFHNFFKTHDAIDVVSHRNGLCHGFEFRAKPNGTVVCTLHEHWAETEFAKNSEYVRGMVHRLVALLVEAYKRFHARLQPPPPLHPNAQH